MPRSALLNVMVDAVRKAGRSLARDFGEVENLQVSIKGPGNFVSAADRRAEEILFRELSRARPGYGFLMEERGAIEGDGEHRWLVDPLDGTTNFLHGIPLFAISLALERRGQIVAGVIYNPATDELFMAEKGAGAFFNDRRMRVARRRHMAECVLVSGLPHLGRARHGEYLKELRTIALNVSGVRGLGSAALSLAWTAAGRFDGYWESGLSPWDLGAGLIMVREAGGFASDHSGGDDILSTGGIIAGNETVRDSLVALLREARRAA